MTAENRERPESERKPRCAPTWPSPRRRLESTSHSWASAWSSTSCPACPAFLWNTHVNYIHLGRRHTCSIAGRGAGHAPILPAETGRPAGHLPPGSRRAGQHNRPSSCSHHCCPYVSSPATPISCPAQALGAGLLGCPLWLLPLGVHPYSSLRPTSRPASFPLRNTERQPAPPHKVHCTHGFAGSQSHFRWSPRFGV